MTAKHLGGSHTNDVEHTLHHCSHLWLATMWMDKLLFHISKIGRIIENVKSFSLLIPHFRAHKRIYYINKANKFQITLDLCYLPRPYFNGRYEGPWVSALRGTEGTEVLIPSHLLFCTNKMSLQLWDRSNVDVQVFATAQSKNKVSLCSCSVWSVILTFTSCL